jgi:glycosyltransferase involved in cell wall biosynthesis
VHTGVVEQLQYEGLKRLAETLMHHPELKAKLVLCTPNSPQDLAACGLGLPCVEIVSLRKEEVLQLQRRASVLVAVLPFTGEIRELERTAFPTKVVEYLCAGAPILAHAPAESFFGQHVLRHQYGLLVDQPEEAALAAALQRLRDDAALRQSLTEKARQTVAGLFALPKAAADFVTACGLDPVALKPEYSAATNAGLQ